ncbi:hypothetical protein MH142_14395 [Bacillus safensis]|uniref:hypothetical protein n=1 Tax=Bacillus safensis TaxID=561879 RepID=UPI00227F2115|nr:hypothetical protein [Bacillus safensis]MCY7661051.1 hypothetical protein [Bacillus safensis]
MQELEHFICCPGYSTNKIKKIKEINISPIGLNRANFADDQEYIAKLKIIYALFEEYNESEVKESLGYLESKSLWQDVAELSEKLADYNYQRGNFEMNREYLKKTIKAQQQILKMAEAL